MKRSIKPPTKAQKARQDKLREFGCICCWIDGGWSPAEIHHINDCGRNMGQDFTIPLCPYHHRGVLADSFPRAGPSLTDGKRTFQAHYGTELELLDKANEAIAYDR